MIFETGIGNASTLGGRKPILLQFNPKAALILSFDIGVDYLKGTLAYLDGEVIMSLQQKRIVVSANLAALGEYVFSLESKTSVSLSIHSGIALCCHNFLNIKELKLYSA